MYLQFILTMPGAASWNGKWSGDGRFYAKTKFLRNDKAGKNQAAKVLEKSPYNYRWPDGWEARVDVERITSRQAESANKKSKGFYGYDWMVDSIMEHQEIMTTRENSPQS